jgi:hypothetical protein
VGDEVGRDDGGDSDKVKIQTDPVLFAPGQPTTTRRSGRIAMEPPAFRAQTPKLTSS